MKRTIILRDSTLFFKGVTADLKSPTRGDLSYMPGTTVYADALDADPTAECAPGIFFCRSLPEALKWAQQGTVVTVRPVGQIVDTGTKLRARAVEVIGIASLTEADLVGANLTSANLMRANLAGTNLARANLMGASLTDANLTEACNIDKALNVPKGA